MYLLPIPPAESDTLPEALPLPEAVEEAAEEVASGAPVSPISKLTDLLAPTSPKPPPADEMPEIVIEPEVVIVEPEVVRKK
eukprot:1817699-Pyramimonas_sp.AAC.1